MEVAVAALTIAVAAVFGNAIDGPFLLDDASSLAGNESIRQLWPLEQATGGGTRGRPTANFSFAINYRLGGLEVRGYHLANLGIHAVSGLLLLAITRLTLRLPRFGGRLDRSANAIALMAALLWVVHPLQTGSVTYLSQRTELLMAMHYLLTLYCFVRALRSVDNGRAWMMMAVLACFAGMAAKEVMVTAPVVVLLYDRALVADSFLAIWRRRGQWYLWLGASWILLAWLMQGVGERGVGMELGVSSWHYALTESRAIVRYLALAAWPHPLVFDYGSSFATSLAEVWPYAVSLVALVGGVLVVWRRRPALGFLLAWPLLILAPSSSVVPVALQPVAEHRMYLPLAGLAVLVVMGLHRLLGARAWVATAALTVALGCSAASRNAVYRDEVGLWRDTIAKVPGNDRAHHNLGTAHMNRNNMAEARQHFEQALALNPSNYQAMNNLGFWWAKTGNPAQAIDWFQRSLRAKPDFAEARYNLGCLLLAAGRLPEAREEFEQAIRANPRHARACNNLGAVLARLELFEEAVESYSRAIALDPTDAEVHANRASANLRLGRASAAIADYEEALRLRPDFRQVREELDVLLRNLVLQMAH